MVQAASLSRRLKCESYEILDTNREDGQFITLHHYRTDLNGDGRNERFSIREETKYSYHKTTLAFYRDLIQGKSDEVTPGTYVKRDTKISLVLLQPNSSMVIKKFNLPAEMSPQSYETGSPVTIFHGARVMIVGNEPSLCLLTDAGEQKIAISDLL
jgi:hypothetical protein